MWNYYYFLLSSLNEVSFHFSLLYSSSKWWFYRDIIFIIKEIYSHGNKINIIERPVFSGIDPCPRATGQHPPRPLEVMILVDSNSVLAADRRRQPWTTRWGLSRCPTSSLLPPLPTPPTTSPTGTSAPTSTPTLSPRQTPPSTYPSSTSGDSAIPNPTSTSLPTSISLAKTGDSSRRMP